MQRLALGALVCALAGPLSAQSNTVPGLDGRLSHVDSLSYSGRRGPAHPNGEIGMSMLNTMCNPGSVTIPWYQAMQPNHPKFGFIATRESGGRMVQICEWSYCKHAFTSVNVNGSCGTCVNPGTGSVMGLRCSDTYGAGLNGNPYYLGPPEELDPWLGTWNPVGSYFDRGDPAAVGAAATDGVRSLTSSQTAAFDPVKHRVTVRENELLVAGARYFYGIHLMHQGEDADNRGDNLASRGFVPTWNGTTWSFPNNAVGQVWGSILQHWTGATLNSARNGEDDGTFFVAAKVTNPAPGVHHYEYAVHNADNHRGGAAFRIPLAAGGTAVNFGFRDLDTNPLNDWVGSVVGNEIVFAAPAGGVPLNWNTIYNFWFDSGTAPANGSVRVDQARVGPGQIAVTVNSRVPSGQPAADVASLGASCGSCVSSVYELFSSTGFDLQNRGMTFTLVNGAYSVGNGTGTWVVPTGAALSLADDAQATVTVPFSLPYPGGTTNSLVVCSNGFVSAGTGNGTNYTPTAAEFLSGPRPRWAALWHDLNPAAGGQVIVDSSPTVVRITWLNVRNFGQTSTATFQYQFFPNGTVHVIWQAVANAGNGYLVGYTPGNGASDPGATDLSAALATPFTLCSGTITPLTFAATAFPVIGTSIGLTTSNIPAGSAFAATILSFQQASPPQDLTPIGMEGCQAHVVGGATHMFFAPGASTVVPLAIPNQPSVIGVEFFGQGFSYSPPLTTLGAIASNGLRLRVGL